MPTKSTSLNLLVVGILLLSACTSSINQPLQVISSQNAAQLTELNRWGQGTLLQVVYSPDGKLIAIRSGSGIYLYDAASFKQVRFIRAEDHPVDMAFSNDNSTLALVTISSRENVEKIIVGLYSISNGKKIRNLILPCGEDSPCGGIDVVFSSNDKMLAISGRGIELWSAKTGRKICTISEFSSFTVAFSHDGKTIAGSGERGTLKVWDIDSGKEIKIFGEPTSAKGIPIPIGISFSPESV